MHALLSKEHRRDRDAGVMFQYVCNSVPLCTHCMCDMFHPGLVSGLAVAGG